MNSEIQPDPAEGQHSVPESPVKKPAASREILAYLHDAVYTLAAVLVIIMLFFKTAVVSGPSMMPTLVDGDYLILLNSTFYRTCRPGDIVVCSKQGFKNGEPIIKRVIATAGQKVDIDFIEGIVYVDDVAIDASYTNTPTTLYEGTEFPLIVDDNCLFVLGDNRNSSKDSRDPIIGLIDRREVLGKALFLFLPGEDPMEKERKFDRIGVL